MTRKFELVSLRFENVRGFYDATLPLSNKQTLIVGRNHAGKTSAFLLLAWVINEADPKRLFQRDHLSSRECNLLLPSRTARHRARRITLRVRIPDGRVARRYSAENNIATLRIGIRISGGARAFIQLGRPTRHSGVRSHDNARILLERIQEMYSVLHIPAARDATSTQFRRRFKGLFEARLSERALHPGTQSGATTEYKQVSATITALEQMSEGLLGPLLSDLADSLPPGLLRESKLYLNTETSQESLVQWIVDQMVLKLVTGDHDNSGVGPPDVGAGLQSVLDMAAAAIILRESKRHFLVAVEEPESYLHPSTQRTIARMVLGEKYGEHTFVSTHSPILVEEASYENLVLAVDRRFVRPRAVSNKRAEINSALLMGQGAEMIFASSILFVEGAGDKSFFEGLRRRFATKDKSGRVDNLYIVEVGGKTNFGPWIRLLQGLNGEHASEPINYIVVPDGDATAEIQTALRDSGISIPHNISSLLTSARNHFGEQNFTDWTESLTEANSHLATSNPPIPLCFLEGDLEYAIFSNISSTECAQWAEKWGFTFTDKDAFIKRMGSKAIDGIGGSDYKKPYMRKQLSEKMALAALSDNVTSILRRWLSNGGLASAEIDALLTN